MEIYTLDSGKIINSMAKEFMCLLVKNDLKDFSKMDFEMDMEHFTILMDEFIKENG